MMRKIIYAGVFAVLVVFLGLYLSTQARQPVISLPLEYRQLSGTMLRPDVQAGNVICDIHLAKAFSSGGKDHRFTWNAVEADSIRFNLFLTSIRETRSLFSMPKSYYWDDMLQPEMTMLVVEPIIDAGHIVIALNIVGGNWEFVCADSLTFTLYLSPKPQGFVWQNL